MSPPTWASPAQLDFLNSRKPDFKLAQEEKRLPTFWDHLHRDFFLLWAGPEAEAQDNSGGAEPSQKSKRRNRSRMLKVEAFLTTDEWITDRKHKLNNWFNNHGLGKKSRTKGPVINLGSISIDPPPKRLQTELHIYSKRYYSKVKEAVDKECKENGIGEQGRITVVNRHLAESYKTESNEIKEEIQGLRREQEDAKEAAKEAANNGTTTTEERTPEDYAHALEFLPEICSEFSQYIDKTTGWAITIIAGGPDPMDNGNIRTIGYHSHKNKYGLSFGKACTSFQDSYLKPFSEYLHTVYSPDDMKRRAKGFKLEEATTSKSLPTFGCTSQSALIDKLPGPLGPSNIMAVASPTSEPRIFTAPGGAEAQSENIPPVPSSTLHLPTTLSTPDRTIHATLNPMLRAPLAPVDPLTNGWPSIVAPTTLAAPSVPGVSLANGWPNELDLVPPKALLPGVEALGDSNSNGTEMDDFLDKLSNMTQEEFNRLYDGTQDGNTLSAHPFQGSNTQSVDPWAGKDLNGGTAALEAPGAAAGVPIYHQLIPPSTVTAPPPAETLTAPPAAATPPPLTAPTGHPLAAAIPPAPAVAPTAPPLVAAIPPAPATPTAPPAVAPTAPPLVAAIPPAPTPPIALPVVAPTAPPLAAAIPPALVTPTVPHAETLPTPATTTVPPAAASTASPAAASTAPPTAASTTPPPDTTEQERCARLRKPAGPKEVIALTAQPDKVPEWLETTHQYLADGISDTDWLSCLEAWFLFEKENALLTGSHRFTSVKFRPEELSKWLTLRKVERFESLPDIPNLGAFGDQWCAWWNSLQPEGRQKLEGLPLPLTPEDNDASLNTIKKGGRNGLTTVLIGLKWWADVREGDGRWLAAVNDIRECYKRFGKVGAKRKAGEGDSKAVKKRKAAI